MSLLTRCPRCRTLFRVTPPQLQARSGTVRCGRCMNAFDAYQARAPEQPNTLAVLASIAPPPAAPRSVASTNAPLEQHTAPAAPHPHTLRSPAPAVSAPTPQPAAVPPPTTAPDPAAAPVAERILHKPTRHEMWYWGAVGLGVLLALQLAFGYRSELSARYSSLRSA